MNAIPSFAPISTAALDEHWFTLRLRTWKAVASIVKQSGVEQKMLAERIGMDPSQFNKVVTGKKSNVTLRTLHNIARAADHRLKITLEPLADLPKPNYSYENAKLDLVLDKKTELPMMDNWTRGQAGSKPLETVL